MQTAEEFIREKVRSRNKIEGDMMALHMYQVNGEDALRWAHEYASQFKDKPKAGKMVFEKKYPAKGEFPKKDLKEVFVRNPNAFNVNNGIIQGLSVAKYSYYNKTFFETDDDDAIHPDYWLEEILFQSSRGQELPTDEEIKELNWIIEQLNGVINCDFNGEMCNDCRGVLIRIMTTLKKYEVAVLAPSSNSMNIEGLKKYTEKDIYKAIQNDRKLLRQTDCFQVAQLPKIKVNINPMDV